MKQYLKIVTTNETYYVEDPLHLVYPEDGLDMIVNKAYIISNEQLEEVKDLCISRKYIVAMYNIKVRS